MFKLQVFFILTLILTLNCLISIVYTDYAIPSKWRRAKKVAFRSETSLRLELKARIPVTSFTDVLIELPTEFNFNEITEKWLAKLQETGNELTSDGYGGPMYSRGKREIGKLKLIENSTYYDFCLEHPWGERASVFPSILQLLNSLGFDGKNCLLRAVCEIHEDSLDGYGLLGEIVILFFSTSKSPLAKTPLLREFLRAERLGKRKTCGSYAEKCPTSIFQ